MGSTEAEGRGAGLWLAARSLLWLLLLPGFFAGWLPWRYFGLRDVVLDFGSARQVLALAGMALGAALLVACVVEFARSGRGTLSPVDPPKMLVVRGLYRYVRNPMYLSVTVLVLSEALLAGSRALLLYWVAWFVCVNLFVMGYEERALDRQFGASYREYRWSVRRWIPRLRG